MVMFSKTRQRIDEKFTVPVQRVAIVAYAALVLALAALIFVLAGSRPKAVSHAV